MRALVYTDIQQSEMRDEPEPSVLEGQVIVDISHCGICGSDMHAWHGHDARRVPPLVLGHEAVGIARSGVHAGRRVAINPLMTCGSCEACTSGQEHLCAERELIGMRVPGAFAERVAISECNLYPLPGHLGFEEAALAEPLAVCVHACNLALDRLKRKPSDALAVVLGGGAIGLLSALVLKNAGIGRIMVGETNGGRKAILEALGGIDVYDPADTAQTPAGGSADLVIDAVGIGTTRAAASSFTRPGGTIVHVGLQDNTEGLDTRRITLQEIAFIGTYCYTRKDFQAALDMLADGRISGNGWAELRKLEDGVQSFLDIHNGAAPPKIILEI